MQEEKKIIEKDVACNVVDASVYDLCFFQNESGDLLDYAESDDVKTASDCVFSFGRVVSVWSSKKQERITQSSTKAQRVSAATDTEIWQMKFCQMKVGKMRPMLGVFSRKISRRSVGD
jgi:hypothetical protein